MSELPQQQSTTEEQHNTTQHNTTQHNTTQHNTTPVDSDPGLGDRYTHADRDEVGVGLARTAQLEPDQLEARTHSGSESEASLERWADEAKRVLAKKYEEYGVTEADFSLVEVPGKNGEVASHVVMLTSPRGIDLGDPEERYVPRSYDTIMSNFVLLKGEDELDDLFKVGINGKVIDTRSLTEAAYRAFAQSQIDEGVTPLPDDEFDSRIETYTWLTGEDIGRNVALVGRTITYMKDDWRGIRGESRVDIFGALSSASDRRFRFRPTVVWDRSVSDEEVAPPREDERSNHEEPAESAVRGRMPSMVGNDGRLYRYGQYPLSARHPKPGDHPMTGRQYYG